MHRFLFLLLVLVGTSLQAAVQYPRPLNVSHSRSAPYVFVGQLEFSSGVKEYIGSASVIRPRSVLTAGHNVYDADTGWSTAIQFNRGRFGASSLSTQKPNHIYLLAGYQQNAQTHGPDDVYSFAFDAAGLTFKTYLAGGGYLPFTTNQGFLTPGIYRMGVGYAAEGQHSGDYPFTSTASEGFSRTRGGFFESANVYFEGGMSGGPMLVPGYYGFQVAGLIVSSSSGPVYGGIRVVDNPLATLIRTYLY